MGATCGIARTLGWRMPVSAGALIAAAAAMAGSDGPMFALEMSDPREWSARDWASDVAPHVAYGMVTAAPLTTAIR